MNARLSETPKISCPPGDVDPTTAAESLQAASRSDFGSFRLALLVGEAVSFVGETNSTTWSIA